MRIRRCLLPCSILEVVVGLCACVLPARAGQIVLAQDDRGQSVYINLPSEPAVTRFPFSFTPATSSSVRVAPRAIQQWVGETASRYNVDPKLVDAVIRVESGYDPRAVSAKGAMGLMQLIPATAQLFGVENAFDPQQNIRGGVTYLKYLLDTFGGDVRLSLAAYNAGEHSVLRSGGVPPIPETRDYVRKVTSIYGTHSANGSVPRKTLPEPAPILQYTDAQGVIHFTNDGGL